MKPFIISAFLLILTNFGYGQSDTTTTVNKVIQLSNVDVKNLASQTAAIEDLKNKIDALATQLSDAQNRLKHDEYEIYAHRVFRVNPKADPNDKFNLMTGCDESSKENCNYADAVFLPSIDDMRFLLIDDSLVAYLDWDTQASLPIGSYYLR